METIETYEQFLSYARSCRDSLDLKKGKKKAGEEGMHLISVCSSSGCHASGSEEVLAEFERIVREKKLEKKVRVEICGCFGFCEKGPIVKIFPEGIFYIQVHKEDCARIVDALLKGEKPLEDKLYTDPLSGKKVAKQEDIRFYKKQKRIALRDCGLINPLSLEEYVANRGFSGLAKVLFKLSEDEVIEEMKISGLRGRGGAGFPTWKKWDIARKVPGEVKYLICNADEGDPGAFMDRSIMEGDPFGVLEGMIIAAHAIRATSGVIYIRAEYPLAVERLEKGIGILRAHGLLGKNIMGSGYDFDIEIKYGAGAFVCGEETALISSVEGGRGEPRVKPPFPAVSGLFGKPTNVNNVETLVNVPYIFAEGAEKFASIGSEKSKGTKVFALAGKINNVGLVEVPMGTTLREIIYDIGGGIKNGKKFKAVQTGGPSGGCIPASLIDTPIDYDTLTSIGSMMGSGGMIVMDEDNCMVNIAKFYLTFTCDESCGKCTPCRVGNKRLLEILTKITEGNGTMEDLDKLESLANVIKDTALCGLGQSSPNPVLSTLKYFRDEYVEHVVNKLCPAKECKALARYWIDPAKCIGCDICAKKCPVEAISKTDEQARNPKLFIHEIDDHKCIRCGTCAANCPVKAISLN
jgi:NADH:ubiquinone oxidoreductase subunit F (NADH-binding)/(2Fe-2S) ferredoxin/ferredoxin